MTDRGTGIGPGPDRDATRSLHQFVRIAWNFVQAKLHHAYPCGRCGYRYDCPDGECHS